MKKILFLLAFVLAGASAIAQGWVAPSNSEYLYSTVVFARLNTNLFPSSSNLEPLSTAIARPWPPLIPPFPATRSIRFTS